MTDRARHVTHTRDRPGASHDTHRDRPGASHDKHLLQLGVRVDLLSARTDDAALHVGRQTLQRLSRGEQSERTAEGEESEHMGM